MLFRQKAFSLLLALLLCVPAAAQTNKKIRALEKERTVLKKKMGENQKKLNTTKKNVAAQLSQLTLLNARITQQQHTVDTIRTQVSALSADIVQLETQLTALRADLAACKLKYRRAVTYMNHNRLLQNRWTFVFMANSFRQMYRRMRYASEYTKYLRAQGEVIKQKEREVRAAQDALRQAHAKKQNLLSQARREHATLEGQKTERQGVVKQLQTQQTQLQGAIAQARRREQQLNANIERLVQQEIAAAEARRKKAEAARRAAEEKRRREQARREAAARSSKNKRSESRGGGAKNEPARRESPAYVAEDPADRTISSGFAANQGRLPVPITGSYAVTSRYGQYNVEGLSGVTLDSKGINLTGHAGAQARCVYTGEVSAIAALSGTYIVIVRHGSYFSVYSNLSSVAVRRGQQVSTRQILGNVAADPSGNHTLHFQLRRKNGNTAGHINPLPWLAR